MKQPAVTYADAGVNIDAGNALVERIKPLAKSTGRSGLLGGIGGFGALFDLKAAGYKDPILVSGTDGVGTKIKIAQHLGIHNTIGIDLVAMCVNDLIVQGAESLFFLDYFATSSLDVAVAEQVVAGIAEGCKRAGCALVGGETAEMPGMYQAGEYDLAGFAVGAVERDGLLPSGICEGDVLLGLASSGFHSNGYSLVRHIVADQKIDLRAKEHHSLAMSLLEPTRIYVQSCLAAIKSGGVKGLAHITGGGLTENLPRILSDSISAEIQLSAIEMPSVMTWLQQAGNISEPEMLRTFNCGIGMVVVVDPKVAEKLIGVFTAAGDQAKLIGRITAKANERVTYIT